MTSNTRRRVGMSGAIASAVVAATLIVPAAPALGSTTDAAFNSNTGTLNVNYASYLSKHDIVYNAPNTNPLYGLTVGNGRTGAMVWNANQLTMQVSGVDLSEQSAYAAGNVTLGTSPALDSGYTTFQQRLSLYDGTLATTYDTNRTVTIMGSANSEVMGIHVEDSRAGVSAITLDLSLWDLNAVSNSADVPNLTTWRTASTFADTTGIGISRGQADPNGFGYTLAATVEGASYSSSTVNGTRVRLSITPTSSYTIWFTAASRINSPGQNSVTQARNQLAAVKAAGYTTTLANYRTWWHDFWARSFVQYSNGGGDADYLENIYYLATYMIAAGGFGNYPYHFINGVFRATEDRTKWSNGYWYWNQRDVYNSFLASNHTDLIATFNRLYSRNVDALRSYTQTRYGVANALWVPETMGWDGNARGTINSDFVNDIYSTGTEAAYNMYLQYRYTNDTAYLQTTVYPYMRDVLRFYQNRFQLQNNEWVMPSSNAHETYWDVRNAITDLAAIRLLAPIAIQVATQLDLDSGLRTQWQDLLNRLHPYQLSGSAWLPHDPPSSQQRNGENVSAELIWPYDRTGIGAADYQTALNTWNARPNPYGNVWANDHAQAARLGLGDQAFNGMKTMLQRYQNYPNGMTNNDNGVFEYLGIHLVAMNESLLQSYNDKIRVFPAVPSMSGFVGKFTLLAKDGFLVSSEREGGEIKYVGLHSLHGKQATVVNPWGTEQVRVRRTSDNAILLSSSAAEVSFATAANTSYVLERTAKPLSTYTATTLTGTQNNGVKLLSGTASRLGIAAGGGSGITGPSFYPNANYGGTGVTLGVGDYDLPSFQSLGLTNDSISSIRVPVGFSVTAYGDSNFSGPSWTYTADTPSLTSANGNDAISSIRVVSTGPTGPTFYPDASYGGTGVTLGVGDYTLSQLQASGIANDSVSSIRVPSGFTVTAYANGDLTGTVWTFTADNPNLAATGGNDLISAVRVSTGGGGGSGGVALRSRANSLYVTAGTSPLIANASTVGTAQRFDLIDLGNGNVALRAQVNAQYVCAENAGAANLIANRASVGAWETFRRITNANGTVSFQATVNDLYVVAENAGAQPLIANRASIGPWEQFDLVTL